MDYLGLILTIINTVAGIVKTKQESDLAELNALPPEAKAARALQMAKEQADTYAFWSPVTSALVKLQTQLASKIQS